MNNDQLAFPTGSFPSQLHTADILHGIHTYVSFSLFLDDGVTV